MHRVESTAPLFYYRHPSLGDRTRHTFKICCSLFAEHGNLKVWFNSCMFCHRGLVLLRNSCEIILRYELASLYKLCTEDSTNKPLQPIKTAKNICWLMYSVWHKLKVNRLLVLNDSIKTKLADRILWGAYCNQQTCKQAYPGWDL